MEDKLFYRIIEEMQKDLAIGDLTAIEELLNFIPRKHLISFLPEEEWINFNDEREYQCSNCGGGFKHDEMVFDDENDLCKDCAK